MSNSAVRPLAGLATVTVIGIIVAVAVALFRGDVFTDAVPVSVLAPRAGLVMNPDAKVKLRDVEVGRVSSIDDLPDGMAEIHLAIKPEKIGEIPENVRVDVASTTVFGAKYVQLVTPPQPSSQPIRSGQVVDADHVTVELNTIFGQLTSVTSSIDPTKLNATLTALSSALNGRGQKLGETITNLDSFLTELDPSLPNLSHDLATVPTVLNTYADVAPDLLRTVGNATRLSRTVFDQRAHLDAFLVSLLGVADTSNDVLGANRQGLTDVLHLLTPITALTNKYNPALTCALSGVIPLIDAPPFEEPGAEVLTGFTWGSERYRFPGDLPKVAAKGGPHCTGLPNLPFETRPPYLVADTGSNPYRYTNPGIMANFDGLKQALFGPIDGPPRNSAQIGQPG